MEDKRKYILDNTGQLYLRYGIRSVTMDDVARELGISKKTIYQHFKDKEELVAQTIQHFMDNPCFGFRPDEPINAIDKIIRIREHARNMLKIVNNNLEFDLRKSYPELYAKMKATKKERIYNQNFEMFLQGVQEGLFRESLDADFIARLSMGRILLVLNPENEIFNDDEIRTEGFIDKIIDYHMHAVCTPKGLDYYKQQINNVQHEN